jgi:hypothetical protein
LLELDEVRRLVGPFDKEALFFPWKHRDPRLDALSAEIQGIAAASETLKRSRSAAFAGIWEAAHRAAGLAAPDADRTAEPAPSPGGRVPFLSEPWYCCAEPTRDQFVSIVAPEKAAPEPVVHRTEGFV